MLFVKCGTKSQNPSIMMLGNWSRTTANFKKDTPKESFLATQKNRIQKLKMQPNTSFQRTRATKRLGIFGFRWVARGAERGR
jgi:hypothetical protein